MQNLKRNERRLYSGAWIGSLYILVVAIAATAESIGGLGAPILAIILIAGLQNHLQILLHEGAHRQLHPTPRINDWLSDVGCAIPFGGFVRHYRHFHLLHHTHLLDPEKDPEISFYAEQGYRFLPLSPVERAKMYLLDFCGYHYSQFFTSYNLYLWKEAHAGRMKGIVRDEFKRLFLVAAIIGICVWCGYTRQILIYWVLPQVSFLFFFLKQQGYGEHGQRKGRIEDCTYSPKPGFIGRFFIYPLNSHHHREHHLYPTVPWYRLHSIEKRQKCDAS